MTDFEALLKALNRAKVRFVIVGAYAAVAHGSSSVTSDLDICYERTSENIKNLAKALRPFRPRLRGVSANVPFTLDEKTLNSGMNFTLTSSAGDVDLFGELVGVGQFDAVSQGARKVMLFGEPFRIASLDVIIASKRAAGRLKDLVVIAELEALKELKSGHKT
jgi:hypothetical protein